MVILALDTTTRAGSCALWRDGQVVEERAGDAARTHAERLPGDLADLLSAHGLRVKDVELYAVAAGPGSFTGLRVGIATIQGLALVHGRMVVPVSALEALAQSACPPSPPEVPGGEGAGGCGGLTSSAFVGAWMEAYRSEVFGALYRLTAADIEEIAAPAVAPPAALAAQWTPLVGGRDLTVIGDAVPSTRDPLAAAFPHARLLDAVPIAGTIARIAAAHPDRAVRPHAIVPLYVRRPDAELARDRRHDVTSPAT